MKKVVLIFFLVFQVIQLFAQIPTNGLVACYPFNGNANDMSGNGNHGTNNGASLTTDRFGTSNAAYVFDGSTSYISIPITQFLLNNYSYSVWAYPLSDPPANSMMPVLSIGGLGGDQDISTTDNYSTGGTVGWTFTNYNVSIPLVGWDQGTLPPINTWYHIVMTRDNNYFKAYINGVLVNTQAVSGFPDYSATPASNIGKRSHLNQFFNGKIDDILIYNRALTAAEVTTLYNINPGTIQVNISANPSGTVCPGTSVTLTGTGTENYSWNTGSNSDTIMVSPLVTTTYTVTGTASDCEGGGISSITYTVNVFPAININATPVPDTICSGGFTDLTGSGATTYSWNPGGLSGTTITVSPTITTTYTVTGTVGTCTATTTVTVIVNQLPNVNTSSTSSTCNLNNGSATATPSGGISPYTYSWNTSPVQMGATANNIPSGNYIVTVTDANGCSKTASVNVSSTGGPLAIVSADITITPGDSVQLNASGGGSYLWTPSSGLSCVTCPDPMASPNNSTIYCVVVTDTNSCSDTACVKVSVELLCGDVYVPNAFSPNDDGKNDVLYVRGNCITTMTFVIYDRWGEKVFETKDPLTGWNGKLHNKFCNTGVFVWYLYATLIDGTEISKKGNLTLFK